MLVAWPASFRAHPLRNVCHRLILRDQLILFTLEHAGTRQTFRVKNFCPYLLMGRKKKTTNRHVHADICFAFHSAALTNFLTYLSFSGNAAVGGCPTSTMAVRTYKLRYAAKYSTRANCRVRQQRTDMSRLSNFVATFVS